MPFGRMRPRTSFPAPSDSIPLGWLGSWTDRVHRLLRQMLTRTARTPGADWAPRAGRSRSANAVELSPDGCSCGDNVNGPGRTTDFTRLLTTAIEAAANGVWITDREGVVQWVNPAFSALTGYSQQEMVGQKPSILKAGVHPLSFYKRMWDTILAGRVWHGELSNRHKLGHIYVEEQTIAPVSNEAGQITHFIGVKQDVTRRKEYEQALKTRNAELALLTTIIATVTSSLEVDSVLESIAESARELIPGTVGATLQFPGPSGLLITRAASSSLRPRRPPLVFEAGRGVAGLAFRDGTSINVARVATDARFSPGGRAPGYRSLIAVPVRSEDRVLGVLSVEGGEEAAFHEHEERLLRLLASSAAIAIEHADEYQARLRAEAELEKYSQRLEAMVRERTADLEAAHAKLLEQQRLEQEIVLAAQVQASLLPDRPPSLPGYEFAGLARAARYVSGDMYDWIGAGPGQCGVALADIAGKGVPAAMLTSTTRALLRDCVSRKEPPGSALSSLNRSLYDDLTRAGMFVTVAVANLNQQTAVLDYASAGHTELLWYRAHQRGCERLRSTAPPIGVLPSLPQEQRRIALRPGDVLVLYSDGVTEAEDRHGEFFGMDRLIDVVLRNAPSGVDALTRSIVEAVDVFSAGERSDDLTIVAVRALPRTVSARFAADLEHLEEVLALVRAVSQAYEPRLAYALELAMSEIVTNVIQHAYGGAGGELRVEFRVETNHLQIDLYDDGIPFDLSKVPAADVGPTSERGRGVAIVRQLVDEVSHTSGTSAGNHWRLVKAIRPEGFGDER